MLVYQKDNNLSDEEIAKRVKLSVAETKDILFCEIEKFTLDRLVEYAERLFSPIRVKFIVEPEKDNLNARVI